jgi:acyl-CoA reductase-like NAD-dependent aldehyde dehydrogenase
VATERLLYIDGENRAASDGARFESFNPFTGTPVANFSDGATDDVDAAVDAARTALDGEWSRMSGSGRAELMFRLADLVEASANELGQLETLENGKLLRETVSQARFAARCYRYFAGVADKILGDVIPLEDASTLDFLVREPVGVCALLIAWNSPMQLLANKLAPALAAGNTVVVKPSEFASASVVEFTRLVAQAGFPKGVVNVVTGWGSRVGAALSGHQGVDLVSLTGGVSTGRAVAVASSQNLARLVLELGGKSPNIVFADADLDRALNGAVAGIFAGAGQSCIAGSRLLIQESIADRFVDALIGQARSIRMGDPMNPDSQMGPLANRLQFDRVFDHVERGLRDGAQLVCGGAKPNAVDLANGLFIEPTIFLDDRNATSVARNEVFGPVLTAIRFKDEDDAVRIANDSEYALAAGVWTRDIGRALRTVKRLHAGTTWVNTYRSVSAAAPFGGYRGSGVGRERGLEGLREYTQAKNVMIDLSEDARDPFVIKN